MPPDPLRPVTGHQPDDQPAQHRHQHRGPAQRVVRRRALLEREVLKIEQIREQVDQPQEHQRRERTARANGHRDRGDPDQSDLRGEMSLFFHDGRSPGPLRDARRLIITQPGIPRRAARFAAVAAAILQGRRDDRGRVLNDHRLPAGGFDSRLKARPYVTHSHSWPLRPATLASIK